MSEVVFENKRVTLGPYREYTLATRLLHQENRTFVSGRRHLRALFFSFTYNWVKVMYKTYNISIQLEVTSAFQQCHITSCFFT